MPESRHEDHSSTFQLGPPPPSRARSSSAGPTYARPQRESPDLLQVFPTPAPQLPAQVIHLPAPAEPLPQRPTSFSTKSLNINVEPPPAQYYTSGDAVSLSFIPIGGVTSVSVRLVATSLVNDGSLLPSGHTILIVTQEIALDQDAHHPRIDIILPEHVDCACREIKCALPPSGRVVLRPERAITASMIVVEYRLEITVKRKGWGKSAEK